MTTTWILPVAAALVVVVGFFMGYVFGRRMSTRRLDEARRVAESIISDAQRSAEATRREAELEARDVTLRMKMEFEEETRSRRDAVERSEVSVAEREGNLARRLELIEQKEEALKERSSALEAKQKVLEEKLRETSRLFAEQNVMLERIAGMRKEDAKNLLLRNLEEDARRDAARLGADIRADAERQAEKDARKIIAMAIQRYAAEQCVETTVSVVDLPSDDMKGRIIGREGRNIRAFEMATGVDVIIDDTPEAVIISAFDPVRREIARLSMERLVDDGRIHPGRIEEVIARTSEEIEEKVLKAGEQACLELDIHGMHTELVRYVGRMKYRTSYGQNCLAHSLEVAHIAGVMAAELKLNQQIARRAGLLHDLGKVVSHEHEGSHTAVGAEVARKFGEGAEVIDAIQAHHGDVEPASLYTPIVSAADAVSGARPGARRESLETYVKRLSKLEEIADGFDGVEKSYAIQAGREIRIIVSNDKINDAGASELAWNISRKLEKEMDYPGQIKVVVIRETRAIEYAR